MGELGVDIHWRFRKQADNAPDILEERSSNGNDKGIRDIGKKGKLGGNMAIGELGKRKNTIADHGSARSVSLVFSWYLKR
jgi:hypothetical protein